MRHVFAEQIIQREINITFYRSFSHFMYCYGSVIYIQIEIQSNKNKKLHRMFIIPWSISPWPKRLFFAENQILTKTAIGKIHNIVHIVPSLSVKYNIIHVNIVIVNVWYSKTFSRKMPQDWQESWNFSISFSVECYFKMLCNELSVMRIYGK